MKIFLMSLLLLFSFCFITPAHAAETHEVYDKVYEESGLESLTEVLSDETKEVIAELGIDLSSYTSFLTMDSKSLWDIIMNIFSGSFTEPFTALSLALCVILICSVLSGMWSTPLEINESYSYICLLSLSSVVLLPLTSQIENCISGIKAISGFMLSFIPVYGGLLISSGGITSGAVYQSVMLALCEGISQIAGFIIAPIIGIFICIGMSSAIAGIDGAYRLAMAIKNVANWVLGFIMTFFTGFLGIQSIVGKSADNLTIKTTRFFVGSAVPVVGGYLGEALTTVTAALVILRSTAMAWFILVLALMVLPLIIRLFLWRLVLNILASVGEMFSVTGVGKLFNICSVALSFLVAIVISISVMFILSLVIIKVGT